MIRRASSTLPRHQKATRDGIEEKGEDDIERGYGKIWRQKLLYFMDLA